MMLSSLLKKWLSTIIDSMWGFKTLASAEKTIVGIEKSYMIYKVQIEEIQCAKSQVQFISEIMSEVA